MTIAKPDGLCMKPKSALLYSELLAECFWELVDKSGDCWLWKQKPNKQGYGIFIVGKRNLRAHRVAYELVRGPIPDGLKLLHSCDVKGVC